jgi:hypothetical protein
MNYLLDDEGLLQLRSREVKLRLLDKKKTVNTSYQMETNQRWLTATHHYMFWPSAILHS